MKKKIVFLTARLPYPPSSGRKAVMYNYCRILKELYGLEVIVVSFFESGDNANDKPHFIDKVYELLSVRSKKKFENIIFKTFLQGAYPLQVSLFWDENIKKKIDEIIAKEQPDILMADMIRTTEYLKDYSIFKVANLDDMLSIRYNRQLQLDEKYLNPYGAYLYTLSKSLQKILQVSFLKRLVIKYETKLLQKYELDITKKFDKTVFVAEGEAQKLNSMNKFDKALSIPLGVDVDYFSEYYRKIEVEEHSIAFLGALSVAHNEAAIIHFVEDILPLIVNKISNAKFYIIGGGANERLKSLASENVIFTGKVDDVRRYVAKCQVFVCPLIFGSGIKTKNLEAMAMGVPIVTTSVGAENIDAPNGSVWFITDNNQDFAKKVVKIMREPEVYSEFQNNAYNFVVNNFTWKAAEEKMKFIL